MQTVSLNDKERWALDTQTPSTILWTTCFNFFFFFLNLYLLITLKSDQWAETGHQIMTELFWHFLFILHGTDWNRLTNSADRWLNEFKKHHRSIVMFMVIFWVSHSLFVQHWYPLLAAARLTITYGSEWIKDTVHVYKDRAMTASTGSVCSYRAQR